MKINSMATRHFVALAALWAVSLLFSAGLSGCQAAPEAPAAQAVVGKPAPDFSLPNTEGAQTRLSDYKGKIVVLEWFNHGCPFVQKHYESGNMQKLQKEMRGKGVVWLSICSSAEGKQGYASPSEHETMFKAKGGAPNAVLVDADGKVGHMYGAKSTPHMFVIDSNGQLVYAGAIDDKRGVNQAEIAGAKNYVRVAVSELKAGKPVTESTTQVYGCAVKYK